MKKVVVDDHAVFRDGVASLLLAWGHKVPDPVGEGEQIELVEAGSPAEVLMDVRMAGGVPGEAGEAARPELEHPEEVAIVVLTVSKEEADLFRAIKAGAQGHPPPSLEAPRLRSLLEGHDSSAPALPPRRSRVAEEFLTDPAASAEALQRLTAREVEVLGLVTEGMRNREIAAAMGISENTVKFHLKNVSEKLHATNRAELAARAVRAGLVPGGGLEGSSIARRTRSQDRRRFDRP
jgi:DNA-binding NarL/FixJ family response regulator